jgi:hypothetical protein
MRCFYHHERDAVGTCKSCGKGLCPECAVDLDKGLACHDRCEAEVRALIRVIEHNVGSVAKSSARQTVLGMAIFMLALGAVNVGWGLLAEPALGFLVIIGCIFLAFGVFGIVSALRMPSFKEATPTDDEEDGTD